MIDLLYIASPSYSGSTLLTFLLNAHPEIATVGELKWGEIDLDTYLCSCGRLLRECSFWSAVSSEMQSCGLPFDLKRPATDFRCRESGWEDRIVRARLRGGVFEKFRDAAVSVLPSSREMWPTVARVNRGLIEIILQLQHGRVFLDGSKDPVRLRYLQKTGDYHIRVIQLIRDGRAVVNSAIKNQGETVELAAGDWRKTHQQINRFVGSFGRDCLLPIRYEDLCTDVSGTLQKIFTFLGLEQTDIPADYRSVEHHILGNRMRLSSNGKIALDEKWRTALSASDLAVFNRIAGYANREFGYA